MKAISNYFHAYLLLVCCGTDSSCPLTSNWNACGCLLLCPFLGTKFYPSSEKPPLLVSVMYMIQLLCHAPEKGLNSEWSLLVRLCLANSVGPRSSPLPPPSPVISCPNNIFTLKNVLPHPIVLLISSLIITTLFSFCDNQRLHADGL